MHTQCAAFPMAFLIEGQERVPAQFSEEQVYDCLLDQIVFRIFPRHANRIR